MFKRLKKKIQEETGAPPDAALTHGGPGLASPIAKDAPDGGFLSTKKDSPLKDGGRRDSTDSMASASADESRSKEDVLALLLKRTDQVKRSESKISELAAMVKDKNRHIERLEASLEKSEEDSSQRILELNEQYQSKRAAALDKKEQEFRARIEKVEKTNEGLQKKLKDAREYREKYFKLAEEDDELQGLNTQELAKVKHMLMNTQDEFAKCKAELEERSDELQASEKQVKQLENEVMLLAEKMSEQKLQSEQLAMDLNEEKKKTAQLNMERTSFKSQLDTANTQLAQKSTQFSLLQTSYHELQNESMVIQRNNDLHRRKVAPPLKYTAKPLI